MMCYILYEIQSLENYRTIAEEFAQTSDQLTNDLRDNIMQMRKMIRSDSLKYITSQNPKEKIDLLYQSSLIRSLTLK